MQALVAHSAASLSCIAAFRYRNLGTQPPLYLALASPVFFALTGIHFGGKRL
jgi:hypothetical protein